jgi:CHAT domain-containing protein
LPRLLIEDEMAVLEQLQRSSPAVKITRLQPASPDLLLEKLKEEFHLLHFVGHAYRGALVLEHSDGRGERLDAGVLATALSRTEMRLLFLNACDTAEADPQLVDRSVSYGLASKGVPLVIGMQCKIPDQDALVFVRTFYRELVGTGNVELAVMEARQKVAEEHLGPVPASWAIPVLLMRGSGSDLLRRRYWLLRRLTLRQDIKTLL